MGLKEGVEKTGRVVLNIGIGVGIITLALPVLAASVSVAVGAIVGAPFYPA